MSLFVPERPTPNDLKQSRLMQMAAVFLLLFSITLTLAPAARYHSWDAPLRWGHWIGFAVWLVGAALMHRLLMRRVPERDPFLFPIAALLSGWGLLTIWRLDTVMGARQTAWLVVSLLALTGGLRVPDLLVLLRRYKYLWLTSGLLLTALTFLFGTYPGGIGPRLWLGCCGVYLQPSEPLKLLMTIYLAAYLADRLPTGLSLPQLLSPTLILTGAALVLLVTQRDLGTASLFILIYSVVIYLASGRRRMLLISLLTLLASGGLGYILFEVVRVRVDAWLNPWLDPAGRSYQIVQSLLSVASGGLIGRGPGLGSPGIVPVAHSDFIFTALTEETGLLGAIGLVLILALLVARGFRAALYANSSYRRYLAAGLTAYLVMQAILITGGNLRLLPLTGVTLPFVSYGGSSLLTAYLSMLLLILISSTEEQEPAPLPMPFPYLLISGALMAGLAAMALITGWWTVIRRDDLIARADNPRRVINERYVQRGAILDRNNVPINRTTGQPGDYLRVYEYPPLSGTTGYNSPLYGLAGLEAGLDGYLRGLQGTPETTVWLDDLLYGQPPPGLDVRLNIDLELQRQADHLLKDHSGALVLLNAKTGQIYAMASHPNFDANQLETSWESLIQNPDAPLLNRVTQGLYPPGAALGPFLLAYTSARGDDLPAPRENEDHAGCAQQRDPKGTFGNQVADGCTAPSLDMAGSLTAADLEQLFNSLGFYEAPNLDMESAASNRVPIEQVDRAAIGAEGLAVTPLQMALSAAALSNNGRRPAPRMAQAVLTIQQGWAEIPPDNEHETLLSGGTQTALLALAVDNQTFWQTVALARDNDNQPLTWFIGGSLAQKQGTQLALALILEEENPDLAVQIGQSLLISAGDK